jgi:hypothetical protein
VVGCRSETRPSHSGTGQQLKMGGYQFLTAHNL